MAKNYANLNTYVCRTGVIKVEYSAVTTSEFTSNRIKHFILAE